MARRIRAADLFCGAGGTSTGLAQACADLGLGLELLAINHWSVAIETHTANHPWAEHRCESLDNVDPRKA
ncbi:MAG: DNA cytosine methyltransferase, partial [Candidatus Methylomirabilales bacterium]